jgi:hypothetical protein
MLLSHRRCFISAAAPVVVVLSQLFAVGVSFFAIYYFILFLICAY